MDVARQGTYLYWKDGALQPIREPWSLQTTASGLCLKGERRVADHLVLAVDASFSSARCIGFEVEFHRSPQARPVTASYKIRGDRLHWQRTDPEAVDSTVEGELLFGPQHHLFPLLRAATGPLVERLAENAGTVIVPWLRDPRDPSQLLLPLASWRHAVPLVADDEPGRRYRYLGGEYGKDGAECRLDQSGLLQRYGWSSPDGHWEVRLTSDPIDQA